MVLVLESLSKTFYLTNSSTNSSTNGVWSIQFLRRFFVLDLGTSPVRRVWVPWLARATRSRCCFVATVIRAIRILTALWNFKQAESNDTTHNLPGIKVHCSQFCTVKALKSKNLPGPFLGKIQWFLCPKMIVVCIFGTKGLCTEILG